MTKFTAKVFCIICLLTVAVGGSSVAIGHALPYGGPAESTEASAWSAL